MADKLDNSITVEGIPLDAYVKKKSDESIDSEITSLLNEENKRVRTTLNHSRKLKYPEAKEDNGPVKIWTASEVAEENKKMGIEIIPEFENVNDSIIYILTEKAPITVPELHKIMAPSMSIESFSSKVSSVWKKNKLMETPLFSRKQTRIGGPGFTYYKAYPGITGKDAVKIFNNQDWKYLKKKREEEQLKSALVSIATSSVKLLNVDEQLIYDMWGMLPCNIRQLHSSINWKGTISSLSSRMSNIYKVFENSDENILVRYKEAGSYGFIYEKGKDMTAEEVVFWYRENKYNSVADGGEDADERAILPQRNTTSNPLDTEKVKSLVDAIEEEPNWGVDDPDEWKADERAILPQREEAEIADVADSTDSLELAIYQLIERLTNGSKSDIMQSIKTEAESAVKKLNIDVNVNFSFKFGK